MTKEEAIQVLESMKSEESYNALIDLCDMAIEALSAETIQGEWIDVNGDGSLWRCDQCKDTACCRGNYCPSCGARMVKGGDDE